MAAEIEGEIVVFFEFLISVAVIGGSGGAECFGDSGLFFPVEGDGAAAVEVAVEGGDAGGAGGGAVEEVAGALGAGGGAYVRRSGGAVEVELGGGGRGHHRHVHFLLFSVCKEKGEGNLQMKSSLERGEWVMEFVVI